MRGVALDGLDQVGDEIGAALVLVLHLGPCGGDGVLGAGNRLVTTAAEQEGGGDGEDGAGVGHEG